MATSAIGISGILYEIRRYKRSHTEIARTTESDSEPAVST